MIWGVIPAIIAILGAVVFVILLKRHPEDRDMTVYPDSIYVMKKRYEKGEISKEAYEEQKRRRGIK